MKLRVRQDKDLFRSILLKTLILLNLKRLVVAPCTEEYILLMSVLHWRRQPVGNHRGLEQADWQHFDEEPVAHLNISINLVRDDVGVPLIIVCRPVGRLQQVVAVGGNGRAAAFALTRRQGGHRDGLAARGAAARVAAGGATLSAQGRGSRARFTPPSSAVLVTKNKTDY